MQTRLAFAVLICSVASSARAAPESRATLLHTAPGQATPGEQLQVDGSLAPGGEPIKKVLLRFRGPGEDYADANMELQYGDLYRGFIPARAVRHPAVEYYVEGVTASGARVPLFMTSARPAKVTVTKEEGAAEAEPGPERQSEKVAEKPPEREPRGKKGKKGKKGKGQIDEMPAENPYLEAAAEKPEKGKAAEAAAEPVHEKETPSEREQPREESRAREKAEPEEATPRRSRGSKEKEAARKVERERRLQEMDEELKVYAAEEPSGVKVRNDRDATRDPRLRQIVTAHQLKQMGVRTVMEALDLVQGVSVSRSMQGFWRVAARGIRTDADVLFLYDGHRLNDLYDGKALCDLPIETLDRIEITRGPMPLDVGTGAVLMLVNLVPNRDAGIRASFGGGSYNRPPGSPRSPAGFDGTLSAAGEWSGLKLFLDGAVWSHGGPIKKITKDALDVDTIRQDKRAATDPAGWTNDQTLRVNVGAGGQYESASLGQLSLKGRFLLENRAGYIGLFDSVGNDSKLSWLDVLIDAGWKKKLSESITVGAAVWFDQRNVKRTWQLSPSDYKTSATTNNLFAEGILEEVRVGERSIGVKVDAALELPFHNTLQAGLSYELRTVFDYAYLTNYNSTPSTEYAGATLQVWHGPNGAPQGFLITPNTGFASRSAIGIWVGDTWRPIEQFTIDVGLRLDLTTLPTVNAAGALTGAGLSPFFGPRVALSLAATPALLFKLSYGRMLREPTVQELGETVPDSVASQGRFIGNPALKPSNTDTVEAGLDWMQGFGEARLKLRGSAFFTSISEAIHPVDPTGNLVPYANRTSGVLVFGADGEARLDVGRMGAFVNASWFRAQDTGTPQSGYLLTDAPQVRLNIGTSVPLGPWFAFDVNLRYGAERRNDQRSTLELLRRYTLPAYALVGAQIRTEPIFDHVELAISAQNVFDLEYADEATRPDRLTGGVPREGWSAFGTIRGWY